MASRIKVLYEDKDILAIDKPAGILVDSISLRYPNVILAHRLDRETSGVLLLAKNKKAHIWLKEQFSAPALELKTKSRLADRQARINKTYVAIVNGWVKHDHGIINKSIGRSPADFRRRLAGRGARGELREAITEYKVLKRFTLPLTPSLRRAGEKVNFSYLEVKPKTGRTHQISVHMKYLNHGVVGDTLYNSSYIPPPPSGHLPLHRGRKREKKIRMMLHALSIEFKDLKGKTVKVASPLPKEFGKLLK